jgi:DNA mismatch repair protein MutS2
LDPKTVVPIDVELDPQTFVLIITGPNTGGKTVTLKTVGLLALMAQAGLHIPVHSGSQISVFDAIYADIGDEQSIEQSLSTFSGHITNIIHILENADARSLVVLDELGAGTDPQEGAALARSILSNLLRRSITTLVTTHHPELKAFAHATPGAVNASVEFDLETLRPTYHLTIGLPGRSNALAIAQRLGLPEALIAEARSELDPQDLHAEDLLDEIHRQRDVARQARAAADQARQEAESLRAALAIRLENLEQERRETLEKARLEAEEELYQVQAEIQEVRRALARARQPVNEVQALEHKVQDLEETVQQPIEPAVPRLDSVERPIKVGDKVRLRSLNLPGVVKSLVGEDTEVQVGALRIRARLGDLELPGRIESQPVFFTGPVSLDQAKAQTQPRPRPEKKQVEPVSLTGTGSTTTPLKSGGAAAGMRASPGMELDLRGQRADDALDALDRFLDSAYLTGLPFVRIIHGKGTGRLREVVRQALAQNPHVRSYEAGGDKEGGEGVTVALLHAS